MQLLTGIFFLLISLLARAEGIYVEVDEDGVPTYSDQRTPDSIEIEIRQPMTYSDTVVGERLQQKSRGLSLLEAKAVIYTATITHPPNDSAVRDNAGSLNLAIVIEPALSQGHTAHLVRDGKAIRRISGSGAIPLNNLDRGTYTFNVRIRNEDDKVIFDGPVTTITMLRHSVLHRSN